MLSKTSKVLVVAALLETTSAIQFRPPKGTVPWKEEIKEPEWKDPKDHDIDYFVPNFGMDWEISASLKNMNQAESDLGHVLNATFEPKKNPWGDDYTMHHFGEDDDIKTTKKNLYEAEAKYGHELNATFEEAEGPPRNYFVPHFGEDTDISDARSNLALVEKDMNHTLDVPEKEDPRKMNYFVPHFGSDQNVRDSMKNLDDAEKTLNHKLEGVKEDGAGSFTLLQTDSDLHLQSDPVCSSAGCTQYKHKKKDLGYKINYPVPNFGRDHDINHNFGSLDWAENSLNHKWVWKTPEKEADPVTYYDNGPLQDDMVTSLKNLKEQEGIHGAWELPPKDYVGIQLSENLNMNEDAQNVQLGQQLMTESDPICSSAGCVQYLHPSKDRGYKINYPVPNFGADPDIIDSRASLKQAEEMQQHELDLPNKKWRKSKVVQWSYDDPLDEDAISTLSNLDEAEKQLGHKWVIG